MPFLMSTDVRDIISEAIIGKKVLLITYQHKDNEQQVVTRKMAPFDIGTTNPIMVESNKNNLYAFCYDHLDKETNQIKPIVHPISINHVISIEATGEIFDENIIADINKNNTKGNYDYRKCSFAFVSERSWFK